MNTSTPDAMQRAAEEAENSGNPYAALEFYDKAYDQTKDKSLLPKLAAEKNDDFRFKLIDNFFSNTAESDPMLDLKNAQRLLIYSQEKKDKII